MKKPPALLLCALAGFAAQRASAAQAPDADLLEFLGSIGEDDDWQDYLEHKPVKAAAGKPAKDVSRTPAKAPDTSSAPAASKEKGK
jgi:hypothetical protein